MKILKIVFILFFIFGSIRNIRAEILDNQYTIGINDVLDISILQPEKIATTVAVTPDGSINFPYIGDIYVNGLTLEKIQKKIQTDLATYMKYPVISISLRESRSRKFYISGAVLHPGTFTLEENTNILKAITIAGGFSNYGYANEIKLMKNKKGMAGYNIFSFKINDIMEGNKTGDTLIQSGDLIEVIEGKFYISGKINRPGIYPIKENTSLTKAITTAGDFINKDLLKEIVVIRKKSRTENETFTVNVNDIENGKASNFSIQPNDEVEVINKGEFYVYGEVGRPGMYLIEKNTTLLKAISMCGGVTLNGSLERTKIKRLKKDINVYEEIFAHNNDYPLENGDIIEVPEKEKFYISGEVVRPGMYFLEDIVTLAKAISMAGGINLNASFERIKIKRIKKDKNEYEEILNIFNNNQNFIITKDDIIEVPEKEKFYISGEVVRPGMYFLEENKITLLKAVSMAGGINRMTFLNRIKVLRLNKSKMDYDEININISDLKENSKNNVIILSEDVISVSKDDINFYILGNIARPGGYTITDENTTVMKAISMAGGFDKNVMEDQVKITRITPAHEEIIINLKELKENSAKDILIKHGDVIEILSILNNFSVTGDISAPGVYLLEKNKETSLLKAISLAGGFSRNSYFSQIKIIRDIKKKKSRETIKVNVKDLLDSTSEPILIQQGDSIEVTAGKFYVSGEVARPGVFLIDENITVFNAITMAGGFNKYGSKNDVKILRHKQGKSEYESIPVNYKAILNGSKESDINLISGDIVIVSEGLF